jgi:hypothetical protein
MMTPPVAPCPITRILALPARGSFGARAIFRLMERSKAPTADNLVGPDGRRNLRSLRRFLNRRLTAAETAESAKTAAAASAKKTRKQRHGRQCGDPGSAGWFVHLGHAVSRQKYKAACQTDRPALALHVLTPVTMPRSRYGFQIILYWPHQGLKSLA